MAKKQRPKSDKLSVPERPLRECDHTSKRGIPYWWSPEWCRDLNGTMGRIKPLKNKSGDVDLYMQSRKGNLTYIQGSIQDEFKQWHTDRQIDYILLGEDPDKLLETDS